MAQNVGGLYTKRQSEAVRFPHQMPKKIWTLKWTLKEGDLNKMGKTWKEVDKITADRNK